MDFGFEDIATDLVLDPPTKDIPDSALLSIFLYHVGPDPQRWNQPPLAVGQGGLVRPPLALRLGYLVTPLLAEEERNQLLLGRVMQALHDAPVIPEVAGAPLDDSRGGGDPQLRLGLEPLSMDELARIWHALGADYRLSVAYQLRVAMIDSAETPRPATSVAEAHVVLERQG